MTLWHESNWIHTASSGKHSKKYSYQGDPSLDFWLSEKDEQREKSILFLCGPCVSLNLYCEYDGSFERTLEILAEYWEGFSFDAFLSDLDTESHMWGANSWSGRGVYKTASFVAGPFRSHLEYTQGEVLARCILDQDPIEYGSLTLQDHLSHLKAIIKADICDPMRAFQTLLGV